MKNNLADIRAAKRLSLRQLERISGVKKTTLSKIENDERTPTVPTAYAICRALGLSIYEVFPDDPQL